MYEIPIVSIIIPCYNAEDKIARCLDSVINQSVSDIEIIIVNDGSKDKSVHIIKKYEKKDTRIRLINSQHKGVSSARNIGIMNAHGKYLQFVDSDDYVKDNYTEKMLEAIQCDDVNLVISSYYQICEKKDNYDMYHSYISTGIYKKREYIKKLMSCPGAHYYGVLWNKMYEREIIIKNNIQFPVNISLGEDFIFNMKYLTFVSKISCIEDKVYVYRWEQLNSLSNIQKKEKERIEDRICMYREYVNFFKREKLGCLLRYKIQYYIVKFYFDELEELEGQAKKYKKYLYQQCIKNCGIMPWEFFVFWILKKGKRLINTITKER